MLTLGAWLAVVCITGLALAAGGQDAAGRAGAWVALWTGSALLWLAVIAGAVAAWDGLTP